jgi:uncharacterized protein YndB with AHSA1/START domain
MSTAVRTATIAAPIDQVWAALADFGAIAEWAGTVDHSCLTTEQADGLGAARRVQVGRNALIERIITWEPGVSLGYEIDGLPALLGRVTNTWTLTASGDATDVALTTEVDAGRRPPRRLLANAVVRKLSEASDRMLAGLTTHLEEAR